MDLNIYHGSWLFGAEFAYDAFDEVVDCVAIRTLALNLAKLPLELCCSISPKQNLEQFGIRNHFECF